jgi:hypothetical protein
MNIVQRVIAGCAEHRPQAGAAWEAVRKSEEIAIFFV